MKEFFKTFLAALLAMLVTTMVICFVMFLVIVGASTMFSASSKAPVTVKNNSVLRIKLNQPIVDRATSNPFEDFDFGGFSSNTEMGLKDILNRINKAKTDSKITGIYLDLKGISVGYANLEEIRRALLDFKESGKWIISYSEVYSQGVYYLATVSDQIYMYPEGALDFRGLQSETMFYKGLTEKLGVEMQVIRGKNNKFKSAVEPFLYDHMSDANKEQVSTFLGAFWNHLLQGISATRGISTDDLNLYADSLMIQSGDDALKYKPVDQLMYKDQVLDDLRMRLGLEEDDKINYTSFEDYRAETGTTLANGAFNSRKPKIAVVYAQGEIHSGQGNNHTIGSERISKAIRQARLDTSVKAIVLRVNSPGGSALASDIIWRETILAKEEKPLIVSMGNLAASGGYYISCGADKIFAEPTTITGSIGVFGVLPNLKGFFNDKLGITFDGVKTNAHSDIGTSSRALDDFEYRKIQIGVEQIYTDFITKVGNGRGMTPAQVDSIGQGRVWSGIDAIKIGLVDEHGGLEDAIAYAKEAAELDDYKLVNYPKRKDPFEEFFMEFKSDVEAKILADRLGINNEYFKTIESVINTKGVQMRMPYVINIY